MNYIHVYTDYIHIVLHRSMNRVRRCAQAMRLPPQKQRCLQRRSRGCGRRKTSQIIARRTNLRPFIYRMYPYVYIILYIYYTEYSLQIQLQIALGPSAQSVSLKTALGREVWPGAVFLRPSQSLDHRHRRLQWIQCCTVSCFIFVVPAYSSQIYAIIKYNK